MKKLIAKKTAISLACYVLLSATTLSAGCYWGIGGGMEIDPRFFKPNVHSAVFSPNGDSIAICLRGKNLAGGLYLIDYEGKAIDYLTNNASRLAFSPDGRKIAFTALKPGPSLSSDVFLMNKDGSNLVSVAANEEYHRALTFTGDGHRLCFVRSNKGSDSNSIYGRPADDGSIICRKIEGGNEQFLSSQLLGTEAWFSFLPGDRLILVSTWVFCHPRGVGFWVMDPGNHDEPKPIMLKLSSLLPAKVLASPTCRSLSAGGFAGSALSKDGRFLLFTLYYCPVENNWDCPSRFHIFLADLTTNETRKLVAFEEGAYAQDISPDGSQILFTTTYGHDMKGPLLNPSNLWIINRDGTGLRNIPLDFSAVMGQGPVNDLEALRQAPPLKQQQPRP